MPNSEADPTTPGGHDRPEVVAIAAVARNGVIGSGGEVPWHISGDLPRFKRLTMGHVMIMGRKTFDSIGQPLPGRTTIVITRNPDWQAEGVQVEQSWDKALQSAVRIDPDAPVFVVGGGEIYRAAWADTDRLEITEVDQTPSGDATFPAIDPQTWTETARDADHDGFAWVTYRRR
jgi:dihydrofolate reductase